MTAFRRHRRHRSHAGVLARLPACVIAVASGGAAQELPASARPFLKTHAVAPIEGPVLLCAERLPDRDLPWDAWSVLAPASDLVPQRLLEVVGDVEPLGFAGAGTLVIRSEGQPKGLLAIELASGRVTALCERPELDGPPLDLGPHGVLLFASDPPHDAHIDGQDEGVARLLLQSTDGGTPRPLCALPRGVERALLRAHLALDGRHVAWSMPWDLGEPGTATELKGAVLVVVDTASGETLRSWSGIEVAVSPCSSSMATLEFAWLDATTLRYGDTAFAVGADGQPSAIDGDFRYVDVGLADAAPRAIHRAGPLGLWHGPPPTTPEPMAAAANPGERAAQGLFEIGDGQLYFRGDRAPVADVAAPTGGERVWFRVAPDGRFALLMRERGAEAEAFLLVGGTRQRVPLTRPGARIVGWFLAAAPR